MKKLTSFEALKKPLPLFSPRNIYYAIIRTILNSVGNLSDGISIGNRFGYDSGVMLDYIYKNKSSGRFIIGKLLDEIYLNSLGWKGIRLRELLLKEYLMKIIKLQLQKKSSIRYLDIACGGGKYGMEVLKGFDTIKIKAEFRDYKKENIDKAKQNAQIYDLKNICFKQADAFDPEKYDGKWDVIVSSGFWENINDDNLVKGNLINIAKCLNSGSVLVFTIQPNQPQLELIARTLTISTGKPWIMRLRSLELFQGWMEKAGLQYLSHRMEKYGIYGVVEAIMLEL